MGGGSFSLKKLDSGNTMNMQYESEIDATKLKYVLYARKSTNDPQRTQRY